MSVVHCNFILHFCHSSMKLFINCQRQYTIVCHVPDNLISSALFSFMKMKVMYMNTCTVHVQSTFCLTYTWGCLNYFVFALFMWTCLFVCVSSIFREVRILYFVYVDILQVNSNFFFSQNSWLDANFVLGPWTLYKYFAFCAILSLHANKIKSGQQINWSWDFF